MTPMPLVHHPIISWPSNLQVSVPPALLAQAQVISVGKLIMQPVSRYRISHIRNIRQLTLLQANNYCSAWRTRMEVRGECLPHYSPWQVGSPAYLLFIRTASLDIGIAGQDTSCLPPAPSTSLAITPNVTSNLSTCDPWGLTVTGGSAPYNVSLMSVGSTIVTNISIPRGFDVLTYINRANPNGETLGMFRKRLPRGHMF